MRANPVAPQVEIEHAQVASGYVGAGFDGRLGALRREAFGRLLTEAPGEVSLINIFSPPLDTRGGKWFVGRVFHRPQGNLGRKLFEVVTDFGPGLVQAGAD